MNKTAIRNFAMWARERMRADVGTRLGLIGINEKEVSAPLSASTADTQYFDIGTDKPVSLTGENIHRRSKLVRDINRKLDAGEAYPTVYEELIESVASTWFNRLIAIRFMEVNDYFPDGLRVLSSKDTGKQVPEIVSNPFESDLEFSASEHEKVTGDSIIKRMSSSGSSFSNAATSSTKDSPDSLLTRLIPQNYS